jgi:putative ABC transport system substrate-binding protein
MAKYLRVGYLTLAGTGSSLKEGLRELGYVEGRNVIVDVRSADGNPGKLHELAVDLVRAKVDVIVAGGPDVVDVLQKVTSTVPIVMIAMIDPVVSGFAASLARPGGNITGLTVHHPETIGKRLQLLKEALPTLSRVGVIFPDAGSFMRSLEETAKALGVRLEILEVKEMAQLDNVLHAARTQGAEALHITETPMLFTNRARLVELATRRRLPAIGIFPESAHAGLLMAYGTSLSALFKRSATHVDRILKGAKPGEIPIERPTKFDLVINLKTAKALGLTIPESMLSRADAIIQ